jgi:hypothetical protein
MKTDKELLRAFEVLRNDKEYDEYLKVNTKKNK